MCSLFIVTCLSLALAAPGVHSAGEAANRTFLENFPDFENVTLSQINNAVFTRRNTDADNAPEKPLGRPTRHTMICDSEIIGSDFNVRSIDAGSTSETPVERKSRHSMICDSEIKDSHFNVRSMNKRRAAGLARNRRSTLIIGGTGFGNRLNVQPSPNFGERLPQGVPPNAPGFFINGQAFAGNQITILPNFNGALNSANTSPMATPQAMPMPTTPTIGNAMNRLTSASVPQSGFASPPLNGQNVPSPFMTTPTVIIPAGSNNAMPTNNGPITLPNNFSGFIQGAVINGATFSRRSLDIDSTSEVPLERKSRDTTIEKSQINNGVFSRRGSDKLAVENNTRI